MIGRPLDRRDARAKVTGAAKYSYEVVVPHAVYGVIVVSSGIAHGRIAAIDTGRALRAPGAIAVLTHHNAPRVNSAAEHADKKLRLLQDDQVLYDRQPIAVVVADTFERATRAAALVRVRYDRAPALLNLHDDGAQQYAPAHANREPTDSRRGDPESAYAAAPVKIDNLYRVADEFHNPMEPHATIAVWEGPRLTLYDAAQGVFSRRSTVAAILGLAESDVRVVSKFVGGGFGSKGGTQAHVLLAAMAAKVVRRPVKIALTREQMFHGTGFRPRTEQRVQLGAKRDGTLVSLSHDVLTRTSTFDDFVEPSAIISRMLYAVPNAATTHRLVRNNVGTPTYQRAPGESSGSFALESAIDELAQATQIDPIELRLRNYAETDPQKGKPFSSKSLRACYAQGAERIDWSRRTPAPRSMRDGGLLIGLGMASATYPTNRSKASASVMVHGDGTALVQSGGIDIGTGAYTAFAQLAAEALGLPVEDVRFDLGDTQMPPAPVAGGSQLTASVGSAIVAVGAAMRAKLAALSLADAASPLHGLSYDAITIANGTLSGGGRSESVAALVQRNGGSVSEMADTTVMRPDEEPYSAHAFGAQFAEVAVDPDFGTVRLRRLVGAFAAGRIVNAKLARSQFLGGMVWGVGMALHEEGRYDDRFGRVMNASLADYLVPVNADIPPVDVVIVDERDDRVNPAGVKGIGEIGIVGMAAAIANAVYHATGVRVRDLPILPEKLIVG